ncbi:hypothetical protein EJ02DRAFT_442990 [Clathrospora elynae]|uniref:Uncharacterized protein n=1 Tax=Clathrospora elynae TaxID=706981 RepID=A0A6A5STL0_9PLEO|nr:hypothetical protein EJ02DRAFT_442990 [Clathrospora elynae]
MLRPQTTINDLPDELLLHIGAQFTNLNRKLDLANLALEWLLKEPRFNLTYIDRYMWQLGHRAELLEHVKSLEICSTSDGRIQSDERGIAQKHHEPIAASGTMLDRDGLKQSCASIVSHFADSKKYEEIWLAALDRDVVPALFGVLLCTLPNLRKLKLGDAWLLDFPLFANMFSQDAKEGLVLPHSWRHHFLVGALTAILPRLKVLEPPTDMKSLFMGIEITALFDMRCFAKLREVGITMRELQQQCYPWHRFAPPDAREIFPKTLQVLRISEATHWTADFLNQLCLAKKVGYFPNLGRVEGVRVMSKDAEIALYVYFPPWIMRTWESGGGTPWRLRAEEGWLRQGEVMCWRKDMVYFRVVKPMFTMREAEWDADGDAVMT